LLEQVTVGAVNLDPVEACIDRVARCLPVLGDNTRSSSSRKARGSETSSKPLAVKVFAFARRAVLDTGGCPFGCKETCDIRPTCHNCSAILPSFACTA
jgi:hypothetical protein